MKIETVAVRITPRRLAWNIAGLELADIAVIGDEALTVNGTLALSGALEGDDVGFTYSADYDAHLVSGELGDNIPAIVSFADTALSNANYLLPEDEASFAFTVRHLPDLTDGTLADRVYTGEAQASSGIYNGLTEGLDYTVEQVVDKKAKEVTVRVVGVGNYAGEIKKRIQLQTSARTHTTGNLGAVSVSLVTGGRWLPEAYIEYDATGKSLNGRFRVYRTLTTDDPLDNGQAEIDALGDSSTRELHLRAEYVRTLKANGVAWIVFIVDDAVLIIPTGALEANVDYRFVITPDPELPESCRASMFKNYVEQAGLPAGDGQTEIPTLLLTALDAKEDVLETNRVEITLTGLNGLPDSTLILYIIPIEQQSAYRQTETTH